MFPKDKLDGNYVLYRDADGKFRTERVIRIVGNTLTVKNTLGERTRIWEGKKSIRTGVAIHIFGRVTPTSKTDEAEEIEWGVERKKRIRVR